MNQMKNYEHLTTQEKEQEEKRSTANKKQCEPMSNFKKFVFVYEISYIAEDIEDAKFQQENEIEGWYIQHQDFEFKKAVEANAEEIQNRLDEIKQFDDWVKSEDKS